MADNKVNIQITAEDKASAAISRVGQAVSGLVNPAQAANTALAGLSGGAALLGLGAIAKSAIDAADSLNDLSQRTGIAVQDLAGYKLAAEQSGTSLDGVARGMKAMATAMYENGDALKAAGITAKDTGGAMRQLADLFADLPDGAQKSAIATKLLGKAGQELIPLLNLGSKGLTESAEASERYGAAMARLAPQADAFNDNLSSISLNMQAMGAEMAGAIIPGLNVVAQAMADATRESTALSASGAVLKTTFETIAVLGANVSFVIGAMVKDMAAFIEISQKAATLDIQGALSVKQGRQAEAKSDRAALDKFEKNLLNPIKPLTGAKTLDARDLALTSEATRAAAVAANALQEALGKSGTAAKTVKDEFSDLLTKINAKSVGLDASFWKDLQTLHAGYANGRIDIDAYRDAVGKLVTQQKFHQDAVKATAQAEEEWARAAEKARQSAADGVVALQDRAAALEAELATYGLTKSEIEDTIIARLEEQRALASGFDSQAELVANLEKEIDARKRAREAMRGIEARDAAKKAAEEASRAWEKFADDIERSLTDALMRSFESGDSFGQAFVKNLQNTLKTTVLKIAVQAVVSPVTGALQAALGGGQAASAINAGSLLNNGISSLGFGAAQAGINSMAYQGLASMGAEQAAMLAAQDSVFGMAGTAATLEAGGASFAAGAATAMPYVAAALAAASVLGVFDGDGDTTRTGTVYQYGGPDNYRSKFGTFSPWANNAWFGGDMGYEDMADYIKGITALDDKLAATLSASQIAAVQSGLRADAPTGVGFGMEHTNWRTGNADEFIRSERYGIVLDALLPGMGDLARQAQLTDEVIVGLVGDINTLIGVFSQTGEDMSTIAQRAGAYAQANENAATTLARLANSLTSVNSIFDKLGEQLFDASLGGAALADRLVSLSGGLDAFAGLANTYYQRFIADQDNAQEAINSLRKVMVSLGLDTIPKSKEAFKALVEAQDLTTESGQATYVALLKVSGAFADVADTIAAQIAAIEAEQKRLASAILNERDNLLAEADSISGNTAAVRARELAAVDPLNRALKAHVLALQDAAAAQESYQTALASVEEARRSAAMALAEAGGSIQQFVTGLRRSLAGASTGGNLAAARNQYIADLTRAKAGDVGASQSVSGSAQSYLDALRKQATSSAQYNATVAQVASELQALPATVEYARQQVDSLDEIANTATDIETALGKLRTALTSALGSGFKRLDASLDGLLSFDELKESIGALASDEQIRELIRRVDTNGDGQISELEAITAATGEVDTNTADQISELQRLVGETITNSGRMIELNATMDALRNAIVDMTEAEKQQAAITAKNQQLEALVKQQTGTVAAVTAGIENIASLATKYGLSLEDGQGGSASFAVVDGAFSANYNLIRGQESSFAPFKDEFYKSGGVYDQTYGMASTLLDLKSKIEAARAAVVSLGGVPKFAIGTNYVPSDMLAQVHQGERIIPAADNRELMKRLNDGGGRIELGPLLDEVRSLRAEVRAVAGHTGKTSRNIERLMPDGDAMQTRAIA